MDKTAFQQALAYLSAAYDVELSAERAAVYWDQLGGLEAEPFGEAVRVQVGVGRRFPTVAELRELYRDRLRARRLAPVARLTRSRTADRERIATLMGELREKLQGRRARD